MVTVVSIVEGDGEVAALPVLLRRIGLWLSPDVHPDLQYPIRVRRDQFLRRADIFERHLRIAALRCGQPGWILIMLDADDDCPKQLAQDIRQRAAVIVPDRPISVVLANREYEAWLIAGADSLEGKRGFVRGADAVADCEAIRDAKGWLRSHMPAGKYREVDDQPAFSAAVDLDAAYAGSRSFRKLCTDWTKLMRQAANSLHP